MMKTSDPVNILVVDDIPEKILEIELALTELGQNIIKANSGRDALRALLKDDCAVILLDVNMADMDGFETAALIRERKRSEHTPIIFITAFNDEALIAKGYSLGAVDFISTPIDPDVLRTKVGVFVDLYQKTEAVRQQAAHRVQLAREQAARQVAEAAMRRSALLAEASRVLSRSLDIDTTLASLYRTVVPALADACQLVLYDTNNELWFARVAAPATDKASPQGSHGRVEQIGAELAYTVRLAVESGHAQPIAPEVVGNAPNLGVKRKWSSAVVAPLIARDAPIGAIVCCLLPGKRKFEQDDIALIENLASRAATALDNAQLFQTIRDGERRKDEFLAMLGHELRNPLAAITNAGELTKLIEPSDPTFDESLEIIRQQASLMKRLVDDLLDVSRITSGRVQLQKQLVSAGDVVLRVADANHLLFTSRRHKLHLEIPKTEEILLEADPYRLEQILSNLLVNAAKYTDPGGTIWFGARRAGSDVLFRVKDSGIGIGADLLPNVFDLFAQANRSLHRAEGGLGIGLTIVRGLAELHGGRVWATSAGFGHGAEFLVSLPALVDAQATPVPEPPEETETTSQPRRILVVEDQPALARVTVALLQKLGHDVRAAADGPEALLAAREYNPEVVLLDIGLPGMDGYEVARCLRSEFGPDAPMLVAMTGYGQHEVNRHARRAEFDHHLVKPADMGLLRELLTQTK
jgi:signal transduction histidine kinase/DNA-binding response OmpR family regulator